RALGALVSARSGEVGGGGQSGSEDAEADREQPEDVERVPGADEARDRERQARAAPRQQRALGLQARIVDAVPGHHTNMPMMTIATATSTPTTMRPPIPSPGSGSLRRSDVSVRAQPRSA